MLSNDTNLTSPAPPSSHPVYFITENDCLTWGEGVLRTEASAPRSAVLQRTQSLNPHHSPRGERTLFCNGTPVSKS